MNITLCTSSLCRNASSNLASPLGFSTATTLMIGGSIGIIPNIIIIAGIYLKSSLHKPTYYLIANLAASDIMLGIGTILNVILALIDYQIGISRKIHLLLCKIIVILPNTWSYTASIQTLVIISAERYQAIFRPTKVLTTRRVKWLCLIAWGISLIVSIPPAIDASIRRPKLRFCINNGKYTYWTTVINLVLFIFQFALPAVVMTVLYSLILRQLSRGSIVGQIESRKSKKLKRRTIYMLLITTFTFLALATPWALTLAIVAITGKITSQIISSTNNPTIRSIIRLSILMLPFTTLYNPVIYCIFNNQIRQLFIPTCKLFARSKYFAVLPVAQQDSNNINNKDSTPVVLTAHSQSLSKQDTLATIP
ncbi:C-X-C chemokine receptor type 1 [Trichoplax sp. H2]|nr:C-X-C chemokine receptor type 1 [Trichoplax sp. H2]|eukprot:RDD36422.1 C-X-C chemokine receptor type 1 [Trichoplax sp. H2]